MKGIVKYQTSSELIDAYHLNKLVERHSKSLHHFYLYLPKRGESRSPPSGPVHLYHEMATFDIAFFYNSTILPLCV